MAGNLSPPGTSVYSSNTLHVGDGTWDSSRDDFLLPNIQGLNFQTMRYNGMGNRFRSLSEYHSLIIGHGIIAAITFLGLVPSAILIASFYHQRPALALRLHISLQVLTVLMVTVVLMLGYFAVGPERSLTNPHHGIGIAIYVLVVVQALGGWLAHQIERGKMRYHIPIKLMLHQWLGRATALLAMAQIPIGLTLYGSPLVLFVLYALYMTALLAAYFVLVYKANKRVASGIDDRGSYLSGSQSDFVDNPAVDHRHSRLKVLGGTVAGAAGLAALRRRKSLSKHQRSESGTNMLESELGSSGDTGSYLDEKHHAMGIKKKRMWTERLLGSAAAVGAAMGFRRLLATRNRPDINSDAGAWRLPETETPNESTLYVDRMEAGLPLPTSNFGPRTTVGHQDSLQAPPTQPVMGSRMSGDSYRHWDLQQARRKSKLGHRLSGLTTFGALGDYVRRRKEHNYQNQVKSEQQKHERPIAWPQADTQHAEGNQPNSNTANSNIEIFKGQEPHMIATSVTQQPRSAENDFSAPQRMNNGRFQTNSQIDAFTLPPVSRRPMPLGPSLRTEAFNGPPPASISNIPPAPPVHQEHILSTPAGSYSSPARRPKDPGTVTRTSLSGSPRSRTDTSRIARSSLRGIPQPADMAPPVNIRDDTNNQRRDVESPPVSVKVKMHSDGRHVTLRRMGEAEAAAEREGRMSNGRDAIYNSSNLQQIEEPAKLEHISGIQAATGPLPPPQPSEIRLPASQNFSNLDSSTIGGQAINSPAMTVSPQHDAGITGGSYESNRRRRRAERARAQAREASHGENPNQVEFT